MKPLLKICGLKRREDVAMCCRLGVDICGFVVEYPVDVPWDLTKAQCAGLLTAMTPSAKSCIVTGGDREKIFSLALALKPDHVQLHYRETLEDTAFLVRALAPHGIGVIKTIPLDAEERRLQFGTDDAALCTKKLCEAGVYAVLVDSRGPSNAAGPGRPADAAFFRSVKESASCMVMLGGGITPENCSGVIENAAPHMIDVMTGAEISPGIKSASKISSLVVKCSDDPVNPFASCCETACFTPLSG